MLTYGEFPLLSVARLLDHLDPPLGPGDVFVDLGSGAGRLVLAVSLLWPALGACVGMELLPEVHALGVEVRGGVCVCMGVDVCMDVGVWACLSFNPPLTTQTPNPNPNHPNHP